MKISLSEHLELRIKIRKINRLLPRKIITCSNEIYFDTETQHWIAIKREKYAGKERPIVAVFDKENNNIEIITVYPSDEKEIASRVEKGRWIYEKQTN